MKMSSLTFWIALAVLQISAALSLNMPSSHNNTKRQENSPSDTNAEVAFYVWFGAILLFLVLCGVIVYAALRHGHCKPKVQSVGRVVYNPSTERSIAFVPQNGTGLQQVLYPPDYPPPYDPL